jgi:hypothetical protein
MDCDTTSKISSAMLVIVGIIHVIPVIGVFGASALSNLYGVFFRDHNLLILMMHRAVLFGLLGGFFIYAAFTPFLQGLAYLISTVAVVSFLWISLAVGNYNGKVWKIVTVDVFALLCILIGTFAYYNQCLGEDVYEPTCGRAR